MLANRLRKNLARLGPWARREQVTAWRLYDRDIPEVPWTIDLYGPRALVSEYVTPIGRRLSAEAREAELEGVLAAVAEVTGVSRDGIAVKRRERHASAERRSSGHAAHEFAVREHGLELLVNLDDYLDTGLFLDHRVARRRLSKAAAGKRVLNLFCYTGAFSVHAAAGGAASTVSVDLSPTYLAWAGRNFARNGLDEARHRLVRSDVFEFLRADRGAYDVVVLDPPTLSRSSSGRSFDLQRVQGELLGLCLARLAPGGELWFSTNYRQFRLDERAVSGCVVREVTGETTPQDFREGLHRSFVLARR
jgi:23S rRNA G2069 N7-methylase RlmK/C1962 C5-methylase RlmI